LKEKNKKFPASKQPGQARSALKIGGQAANKILKLFFILPTGWRTGLATEK